MIIPFIYIYIDSFPFFNVPSFGSYLYARVIQEHCCFILIRFLYIQNFKLNDSLASFLIPCRLKICGYQNTSKDCLETSTMLPSWAIHGCCVEYRYYSGSCFPYFLVVHSLTLFDLPRKETVRSHAFFC